jgi:hypothetical protein
MLLDNKNAVIYGGGGAIGGAIARAFGGLLSKPRPGKTGPGAADPAA